MAVIADNCEEIIVTVVDINQQKISDWNNLDLKQLPVYEPGLEEIIEEEEIKLILLFKCDRRLVKLI